MFESFDALRNSESRFAAFALASKFVNTDHHEIRTWPGSRAILV